jgi:hypothetical protein
MNCSNRIVISIRTSSSLTWNTKISVAVWIALDVQMIISFLIL